MGQLCKKACRLLLRGGGSSVEPRNWWGCWGRQGRRRDGREVGRLVLGGRQIGGQCGPGSVRQQRGGSEGLEGSRMDLESLKLMCGEQREPAAGRLVRTGWLRRLKVRNDTA